MIEWSKYVPTHDLVVPLLQRMQLCPLLSFFHPFFLLCFSKSKLEIQVTLVDVDFQVVHLGWFLPSPNETWRK